jgi:D-glycero-D-manno-heptose 1,7-bisphosphate phosphatase
MIFEAQHDHRLDLRRSFMIGDKASDIGCGRNASVRTILVQTGYGQSEENACADWIARDIGHAADIIVGTG